MDGKLWNKRGKLCEKNFRLSPIRQDNHFGYGWNFAVRAAWGRVPLQWGWYVQNRKNTDVEWISGAWHIFKFGIKPPAQKMRLWENKKGKSLYSDSPFQVVIKIKYANNLYIWYLTNFWRYQSFHTRSHHHNIWYSHIIRKTWTFILNPRFSKSYV